METLESPPSSVLDNQAPSSLFDFDIETHRPIRAEQFGLERLEAHGRQLATGVRLTKAPPKRDLFTRFHDNARSITRAYAELTAAYQRQERFGTDAEWFLDNYHIISDALTEIRHDLPYGYYKLLPTLGEGSLAGYPRVFLLAVEIIAHSDSSLDENHCVRFIQNFQTMSGLTIGELWAFPIMLRLVLVDNLRRLSDQIIRGSTLRNKVREWAASCAPDKTATAKTTTPPPPFDIDENDDTSCAPGNFSNAFLVCLFELLHEQELEASFGPEWIEQVISSRGQTTTEILRTEQQRQAANQVSIGNCVTSLRVLSTLDWSAFFERTSLVEKILRADPAEVYPAQDFATRDRYRRIIEKLGRRSRLNEMDVAQKALELAQKHAPAPARAAQQSPPLVAALPKKVVEHIGYYLVDDGRDELEASVGYRPSVRDRVLRTLERHPEIAYFGAISAATLALIGILWFCLQSADSQVSAVLAAIAVLLAVLPVTDVAIGLVHMMFTNLVPPRVLPKLDFQKRIPDECATFVVIPCLITKAKSAAGLLERLEVHYLSNPNPELRFALLTDFADADAENMPDDAAAVNAALEGVQTLNRRYPGEDGERFFVFHRHRQWNASQNCWMGWERKRGKLGEFNRLLRGAEDTSFTTQSGDLLSLPRIRYVITLDADTQLPREAAQRMIATLAHPLNQACVDATRQRVVRGYGVLQPRVTMTLRGARKSFFARVFSGSAGLDPYVTAVSDVYQDLFGRGSFTGKGIYDVDAFEEVTGHAFPENRILSHDLVEGNFARCGLVTDIELLDDFPATYPVAARRDHRWTRGDWQILAWLGGRIPGPGNATQRNSLPLLERWKILDNLRRSLVPISLMGFLVFGWVALPTLALFWTAVGALLVAYPLLLQLVPIPGRLVRSIWKRPRPPILPDNLPNTAGQIILSGWLLAYQAWLFADAIGRTLARLWVTHRDLLEWETAAATERRLGTRLEDMFRNMWPAPVLSVAITVVLIVFHPEVLPAATLFLAGWFFSPFVAFLISQPIVKDEAELTDAHRKQLQRVARKTWCFFEKFVAAEDNWLPPDNYQEDPKGIIAHRTSPTNIGLYLLSCVAAHDFGYLSLPALLERLEKTFGTLGRLERSHGHFINWYDTSNLRTLQPAYLSTVDSGNFLACLITLRQGLLEKCKEVIPSPSAGDGLVETFRLLEECLSKLDVPQDSIDPMKEVRQKLKAIKETLAKRPTELLAWRKHLTNLAALTDEFAKREAGYSQLLQEDAAELDRWQEPLRTQIKDRLNELQQLAPWLELLDTTPESLRQLPGAEGRELWRELNGLLVAPTSLILLAGDLLNQKAEDLRALVKDPDTKQWLAKLTEALNQSQAQRILERFRKVIVQCETFEREMDFRVLYNDSRNLFAVGYNLTHERLDNSHYDLLASEACLTSFLAVARGVVPRKHWFQLGRSCTRITGAVSLLSWGGTMFEFLMPRLLMQVYPETLLGESQQTSVDRQIEYGRERRVPWGISESAFSTVDVELNYQYQAFGVPGLGLKRGLANDLVIAPYATMLATMVRPRKAVENFQQLAIEGAEGDYGFYEAIDYTTERLPTQTRSIVVKCFMAHHQGMGLVAIANCLMNDIMPRRFHTEPCVRATELLLQERVPQEVPMVDFAQNEKLLMPSAPANLSLVSRRLGTPHVAQPRIHLISSGEYTVMVTSAGGTRSTWRDLDVTRWREDRTRDQWGQFCYIRDLRSGLAWSAGYQPMRTEPDAYEVIFSLDKAEIRRLDGGIETRTEITVSPENHAEIRRITLSNHNGRSHTLELTSYVEVVLAPHAADMAHPAFGKLFLETEHVPGQEALLCRRRPRSATEEPIWAMHVMAVEGTPTLDEAGQEIQYETSRMKFIGRGRTTEYPAAIEPGARLSGTTGAVLDPVLSLRRRVKVAAGSSVTVAFITAATKKREEAMTLADQYHDFQGVIRAFDLAWAHSQVEIRHLRITAQEAHLYQRLAGHIVFASPLMRAAPATLKSNEQGQMALWRYGISGDLPIVMVRIGDGEQLPLVRELLSAHSYLRFKGLTFDLVILNEHEAGYFEDLQEQLKGLLRGPNERELLDKPGGVFLRKAYQIPREDITLLNTAARCIFVGQRGSLAVHLDRCERLSSTTDNRAAKKTPRKKRKEKEPIRRQASAPADLVFFNGIGGFSANGREYVINLPSDGKLPEESTGFVMGTLPPAPWINVIANPQFGFLASESALGMTWSINSQANRLTSWSNDPVSDPPSEVVYVSDENGDVWSATPLPCGLGASYKTRHGQGYTVYEHTRRGLQHELTVFVPPDDSIKLISLSIRNVGTETRKLSATFFAELVVGGLRDNAPMNVITDVDPETGALIARNPFNANFSSRVTFADVLARPRIFTADRTEFIGRNGAATLPKIFAQATWSATTGAALDPCFALQSNLSIPPGAQKQMVFVLGQGRDIVEVRQLLKKFNDTARANAALNDAKANWDRLLNVIQVKTPNPALDILLNRWILYQVLSCRLWGRSGFYQSSGAYGFRDQLQDVLAIVHTAPAETRAHLLRCAQRQFREGDVQHWWHPQSGAGVRTRFSDDFLWLPFAVCHYVNATGDRAVLDEKIPFLEAPVLRPEQEEDYRSPEISEETATLYEHCARAVENGLRFGAHGLPLMGSGDWNDGMNRVGIEGKGESVWVGWFLLTILKSFATIAEARADKVRADHFRQIMTTLTPAMEKEAWDGKWYRRAYFDDGTPLGSAQNDECRIDSLPQTWAVISGAADTDRARQAMQSVDEMLVRKQDKLIKLFTPPFDKGTLNPGYIKGYVPGIRENGGQYTHAALWVVQAAATLGLGTRAMQYLDLINPVNHATTRAQSDRYQVEPYVVVADIYGEPPLTGKGGWTWYTGSASWFYRVATETMLGLRREGNKLFIAPCIPETWFSFEMTYRFGTTTYQIRVDNPKKKEKGSYRVTVDGSAMTEPCVPLTDDGKTHRVGVVID